MVLQKDVRAYMYFLVDTEDIGLICFCYCCWIDFMLKMYWKVVKFYKYLDIILALMYIYSSRITHLPCDFSDRLLCGCFVNWISCRGNGLSSRFWDKQKTNLLEFDSFVGSIVVLTGSSTIWWRHALIDIFGLQDKFSLTMKIIVLVVCDTWEKRESLFQILITLKEILTCHRQSDV